MTLAVLVVLSLVLTFPQPLVRWVTAPEQILAIAAAVTLMPAVVAWWTSRRTVAALDHQPDDPVQGQLLFIRGGRLTQTLVAVGQAGLILTTGWLELCRKAPLVGGWVLLPSLLALVPFLATLTLAWVGLYRGDRAVRGLAIEAAAWGGRPVRAGWGLPDYLAYAARHQLLFIFVPLLPLLAARDLIVRYERQLAPAGFEFIPDLLLGAAALGVAVLAPAVIRRVWSTQPLPAGPLRERLTALGRKLGVRVREMLVWRSGGISVNAAVLGVVPPLRYVLITDGMLEQMSDTQIEAVYGHEAGHVKQHHIPYFLLFALVSGCLVTIFSLRAREFPALYPLLAAGFGVVLLLKWGLLFSWLSRLFEWQADLFGTRSLVLGGLACHRPCHFHGSATTGAPPASPASAVCSTAAEVFGSALNEVAVLNGIAPDVASWRHPSISSRSRFLQELAADPAAAARFERRITLAKAAIWVAALTGCAWTVYELRLWRLLGL